MDRPAPRKKGPTYDEKRKESEEERSGQTTASQESREGRGKAESHPL